MIIPPRLDTSPAQAHNLGGPERRSGGKESEAMRRLRYFLEDTLSVLTFRGHVTEGGIVLLLIVRCTPYCDADGSAG